MTHLYYRLTDTTDPEERLEDAALYKALYDTFGKGLTLVPGDAPAPKDGLFLGRGKRNEYHDANVLAPPGLPYWNDPAFRDALTRSFIVTDLDGARREVERLHAEGRDAFLKSTRQKHFTGRIDCGQSFHEEMDGIVYSFIDREDCLMVQEAIDMQYERRFLVMNGKVVTQSPVAWHLTPMSRSWIQGETGFDIEDLHYATPQSREARFCPEGTRRMTELAQRIADASETRHLCIDIAVIGSDPATDPIEVIEFNPMQPGAVGLYGCDPIRIADAVWEAMDPELRDTVARRRDGLIPAGLDAEERDPRQMAKDMAANVHPMVKAMLGGDEERLAEDYARLFDAEEVPFEDDDTLSP